MHASVELKLSLSQLSMDALATPLIVFVLHLAVIFSSIPVTCFGRNHLHLCWYSLFFHIPRCVLKHICNTAEQHVRVEQAITWFAS